MTDERSISRGRDAYQSSGRGGLGNIHQASLSRDRPETGPDDFSPTRGREPVVNPNQVFSTGRGGAGNIRSPSRDPSRPPAPVDATERDVVDKYVASQEGVARSSSRGGIGNISRSRSRDPGIPASSAVFSTGCGGVGNIYSGKGTLAEETDEGERRKFSSAQEGFHSTGQGEATNLTATHEPSVEHPAHHLAQVDYEPTGRGGAGNIFRDRSE